MGWGGYVGRDTEIITDRYRMRDERAMFVENEWKSDVYRVNKISANFRNHLMKIDDNTSKERVKEFYQIKENLAYKINLSLSVMRGIESPTVDCIAKAMSISLEDSYKRITQIIRSLDKSKNSHFEVEIDYKYIKENMIKNIFYKIENAIENAEEILTSEMEMLRSDIYTLVDWYYQDSRYLSKEKKTFVDEIKFNNFLINELDTSLCMCPRCGRKTINGLKFCIECSREW